MTNGMLHRFRKGFPCTRTSFAMNFVVLVFREEGEGSTERVQQQQSHIQIFHFMFIIQFQLSIRGKDHRPSMMMTMALITM